jgi:oligopeptide transport system substrate-binding protein
MRPRGLVVGGALLALCVSCNPPGRPAGRSFVIAGCSPADMIPQNQSADCDGQYYEVLFTGLVETDRTTGEYTYGVAESLSSEDQITWTVKIKDGWTFHNGEPVTAHSFVDTWNATASSPAALKDQLSVIEGYDDLNPGEGHAPVATTMSGLKVLDRLTFQVKLVAPGDLNDSVVGDAFDPLPQMFFDEYQAGNLQVWREMPIGDGPYQMEEPWKGDGTPIKLKRYPGYRGAPGRAERIEFRTAEGSEAFLALQRGFVDISRVGVADFRAAQREFGDRLVQRPAELFTSIYFPLYDSRYQDKALRQALSLALDRATITTDVYQGTATPAASLLPPGEAAHRDDACSYCHFDIVAARQKLAASGWSGTLDLFPMAQAFEQDVAEAVAEQWRRNLDIDVVVHPLDLEVLLDRGADRAFTGPWWDVSTLGGPAWLDMFQTDAEFDWAGYSNAEFDRRMTAAHSASSDSEAITYYQQAEDIALEEMPVIPLAYPHQFIAYSERLTNVTYVGDYVALELVEVVG